jgi:hypothetical protein
MEEKNKGDRFFTTLWSTKPVRQTIRVCLAIILFAIISPLFFNTPAFIDQYNFEKYGEIARSFGGYLGPFIALIATLLTFMAFYIQYLANERISDQFEKQQANNHFYKMLDIHIKNVESLEMKSFRIDEDKKTFSTFKKENLFKNGYTTFTLAIKDFIDRPNQLDKLVITYKGKNPIKDVKAERIVNKGSNIFTLMIKDFHFIYYLIKKFNDNGDLEFNLNKEQMMNLTYRIFFWGTNSKHIHTGLIDEKVERKINNYLHNIRKQFRKNKGEKYHFTYKTIEGENKHTFRFIPLSGHSLKLARYFRHLYQTVVHLHNSYKSKIITKVELNNNLNTLRAQLSNEEQLLLYYNYTVGFGRNWDNKGENGYKFLSEYRMIHNIPLYNTIPKDIDSPEKHFEGFINQMKKQDSSFELFECSQKTNSDA